MNPHKRVCVIFGASPALAFSLAQRFGGAGDRVIFAEPSLVSALPQIDQLRSQGRNVESVLLDPLDPAQWRKLVESLDQLDVWVNASAVSNPGLAEELSPVEWQAQMTDALSAAFYGAQAAGRKMLAQSRGVIVNLTQSNAYKPIEGYLASNVASAALVSLTESLGVEWAGRGVRVVGIAVTPAASADHLQRIPLRRSATPDEISEAIVYLASEDASYITAEIIRVDGGWVAYQLF